MTSECYVCHVVHLHNKLVFLNHIERNKKGKKSQTEVLSVFIIIIFFGVAECTYHFRIHTSETR